MSNKEKGFSAVEGLLIFVIVALIGFVGWYVWQAKQNVDKDLSVADTSSNASTVPKKEASTELKKYEDKQLGIKFSYPKSWKLKQYNISPGTTIEVSKNQLKNDDVPDSPYGKDPILFLDFGYTNYTEGEPIKSLLEVKLASSQRVYFYDSAPDVARVFKVDLFDLISSTCMEKECSLKVKGKIMTIHVGSVGNEQAPKYPLDTKNDIYNGIMNIIKTIEINS